MIRFTLEIIANLKGSANGETIFLICGLLVLPYRESPKLVIISNSAYFYFVD